MKKRGALASVNPTRLRSVVLTSSFALLAVGLGACSSHSSDPVDVTSIPPALLPSAARTVASTDGAKTIKKKTPAKKSAIRR